jgi:hypothetical protein
VQIALENVNDFAVYRQGALIRSVKKLLHVLHRRLRFFEAFV